MGEQNSPIVLTSDFGYKDAFVGTMKGVILSINPWARVVDLTHAIRPQDIFHGSFVLSSAVSFFPEGTIFCTVVDPGVGTDRKPVLVRAGEYFFVGPDNGVLWQAAHSCGILSVIHLTRSGYFLETVSHTFHGRDIFAPVAAHLSLGGPPDRFGPEIETLTPLEMPVPEPHGKGLKLTVINVDHFGNLTLNLISKEFERFSGGQFVLECTIPGKSQIRICRYCRTYDHAPDNIPFVLASSTDYMEIAVKNGNAAQTLGLNLLDCLLLYPE